MTNISFVYFDVGGVAIKDFSASRKWQQMKLDMGLPKEKDVEYEAYYSGIEKDVCLGKDIDSYMPEMESNFEFHFPTGFSMLTYFVDHFDANKSLWPVVEIIANHKIKMGLLTDQYPRMLEAINKKKLLPPYKWDVVVDSTVVGVKKPNPKIFSLATRLAGIEPESILFIDNAQKNIDAANTFGWQTFFYNSHDYTKSSQELQKFFSNVL